VRRPISLSVLSLGGVSPRGFHRVHNGVRPLNSRRELQTICFFYLTRGSTTACLTFSSAAIREAYVAATAAVPSGYSTLCLLCANPSAFTCLAACAAYGTSDGHPVLDANCVCATARAAAGVRPTTNAVNRGRASGKLPTGGTPTSVRTTRNLRTRNRNTTSR